MRRHFRSVWILLFCLLLLGCGSGSKRVLGESSAIWKLSDRYAVTYGTLRHVFTYQKDNRYFYLFVSRNPREAGSSKNVIESETKNDRVYALCKSASKVDASETGTYYECLTGSFRYCINLDEENQAVESLLSMSEAIALMENPVPQSDALILINDEWTAYYRLESCNLEIELFPGDGGKQYRSLESKYEPRTEGKDSYLYLESDSIICYTDGTDTVMIKQTNRAGSEHTAYNTVTECKAILALLKTN